MRTRQCFLHGQQKSRVRNNPYSALKVHYMGILSDDFAAVDVREVLCYHSLTEKAKFKRCNERQKPMKESPARRKKRQPIPKWFSGDGSAPPRFLFVFPVISFSGGVVGCGARREPNLSMPRTRHGEHTPRCQIVFLLFQSSKTIFCNLLFARINSCIFVEKRV